MAITIYTLGHSDRSADDFFALLRDVRVATLVDVRGHPASRRYPRFDEAALRVACAAQAIAYHWAGRQFGGQRRGRKDSRHGALPHGLRGFADHAQAPAFVIALGQLLDLGKAAPMVLLCAEREPLDCHRSLIADRLVLAGARVLHLVAVGETRAHVLRPEARVVDGVAVYDLGAQGTLPLH